MEGKIWRVICDTKNSLGGGFKHFYVHPYLGKIPILTYIFSDGLKPPTSSLVFFSCILNSCDRLGNLTCVSLMAWGLMSSEEEANFLANYLGDLEKKTWRMTRVNLLQVVMGHMGMVWYGGTVVVGFGLLLCWLADVCNLVVVSKMFVFSMHSWSQHLTHDFKISDVSVHGYFGCRGWWSTEILGTNPVWIVTW